MRIVLAVAALVTAGVLAVALVVALRTPLAPKSRPAAVRQPVQATTSSPSAGPSVTPSGTPSGRPPVTQAAYTYSLLDDARDKTFNQLLGINNLGHIVGYYGSGAAGHPYRAYILRPPYDLGKYQLVSAPGAVQTQLTGLNEQGVQVGFWSPQNNANMADANTGFYVDNGGFRSVSFPATDNAKPAINQLLGVNDHDIAVGFYTDSRGLRHGYRYNIASGKFAPVTVPGGISVIAASISDGGAVAGFFTTSKGVTSGFLLESTGHLVVLNAPHATLTQALGVSDSGEVVGDYRVGGGSHAATHGFTWTQKRGFTTVDDPAGPGATTVSGVNDVGDLVGFYVDSSGHTNGFLATPNA
jgi:hypothetical protein